MQSPVSRPENFLWREWWSNCLQPRRYTLSQHVETIANLSDAGVSWCQLERPGHKPWRNAKLIQHRVEKHFLGEILTGRKHESFSPIRRTIWVNYNISLTWIVRPFGDDVPLLTMIPGLGRSEVVIKFTQNHVIEKAMTSTILRAQQALKRTTCDGSRMSESLDCSSKAKLLVQNSQT